MCLAIAMYLVTGTISIIVQVLLAIGIFLLTLLGRIILFVCAMIYTVVRPRQEIMESNVLVPFETMYPEYDFEDDLETMTRVSLETLTSQENLTANPESSNHIQQPIPSDRILVTKRKLKIGKKHRTAGRSLDILLPNKKSILGSINRQTKTSGSSTKRNENS